MAIEESAYDASPSLAYCMGPFGRRVSQICYANSTGQASIDCGLHQVRCQKRERNRHIDLTNGAVLSGSDLLNIRNRSRDQLIEPMPPLCNRSDELGAGFSADWTEVGMRGRRRGENNFPRSFRRGLCPGDDQHMLIAMNGLVLLNADAPSHAVKNGTRYRYYISSALIQGQPNKAAKLSRVPATEIEILILSEVRKHLAGKPHNKMEAEGPHSLNDKELISAMSSVLT